MNQGRHKRFYRHMFFRIIYFLTFWNFRHRLVRLNWYGSIHESLWMYHHQNGAGMEVTVLTKYFFWTTVNVPTKKLVMGFISHQHASKNENKNIRKLLMGAFFLELTYCLWNPRTESWTPPWSSLQPTPPGEPSPSPPRWPSFRLRGAVTSSWKKKHRKGENHVGRKSWG